MNMKLPLGKGLENRIRDGLAETGLPVDEAELYLTCLANGPGPLTQTAERLGFSRPYARKLAANLEKIGLVSFAARKKYARTLTASSPETILRLLKEKADRHRRANANLADAMPDILALQLGMSHGKEGVRLIRADRASVLKIRKEILAEADQNGTKFYGSVIDWTRFIEDIDAHHKNRWIAERVRRGIRSRALVFERYGNKDSEKELREVRIIRNASSAPIAAQLYGKKAVVWLLKDRMAMHIVDPDIVRLLNNYFDMAWLKSA